MRLIDADALTKTLEKLWNIHDDQDFCNKDVWREIENAQTVETERTAMVWKPAKGRPVYEKGICSCGYVLSVLQRDFVYCPMCGAKLDWGES